MRAQRDDPSLLGANLRRLVGAEESEESVAASWTLAEALIIFRRSHVKEGG